MPSFYYSTRIQKMNFGRRTKVTSSCKWPIIIEGADAYSVYGGSHVHFGQRQKRTQFRSCLVLRRLFLEVNLRAKKGGREKTGENLLAMVACASTTMTFISSLPLSATRKTKRLGKRTDQEVSVVARRHEHLPETKKV